jgi:DNA-binding LacI/PurR family transcriptional regulator
MLTVIFRKTAAVKGARMTAGAARSGRPGSLTSIAASAGVSVSTVSKVLNGRTDVAPQTRERLGRILRLHGYQVAPRSGIGVVDLLIGHLGSLWSDELIRGAVTAAAETEISVIVSRVASTGEFERWIAISTSRGTLGAVRVLHLPDPAALRTMADARVPLVVIDPQAEPGEDIRSVGTTNWQGGMSAARLLLELGHRRIAAIGGPDHLWPCRARLDGYRSTLRRAGLSVDEDLVRCDELSADAGRRRAGELLGLADPPTAIVAANDAQAFGVLQAIAERGLRSPGDVSVTGFDDLPIATWATPPLTTIRQPIAAMAATAFWMLTSGAPPGSGAEREVRPRHLELETTLVVRHSTAPPRQIAGRDTATVLSAAVAARNESQPVHPVLRLTSATWPATAVPAAGTRPASGTRTPPGPLPARGVKPARLRSCTCSARPGRTGQAGRAGSPGWAACAGPPGHRPASR